MMIKRKIRAASAVVLSFSILMCQGGAQAQVAQALEDHFNSRGALASVQSPSTYNTATRKIVSLGSLQVRTPQTNVNLASFKAPSFAAGCGGIDIYAGGFSFINGDQIELLFRNVIQTAKAFAFQLALRVFTQLVSGVFEDLLDTLNKINSVNINSCESASAAVDLVSENISKGITGNCKSIAKAAGIVDDETAATAYCNDEENVEAFFGTDALNGIFFGNTTPGQSQEEARVEALKQVPVKNYTWEATGNVGGITDRRMREFLMTVVGTYIVLANDGTETKVIAPEKMDAVISFLSDGGTMQIYRCDEELRCLHPVMVDGYNIEIPATEAFTYKVSQLMNSIYGKIAAADGSSGGELTPEEEQFVNKTPFPVQKASLLYSTHEGRNLGFAQLEKYAPIIANENILKFIGDIHTDVMSGANTISAAEGDTFDRWLTDLRATGEKIRDRSLQEQNRIISYNNLLTELKDVEDYNVGAIINQTQLGSR